MALAASAANAQMTDLVTASDPFQVVGAGMRVGVGSLMQDGANIERSMGLNAAVDGQYTYYFANSGKSKPIFGIRSGLAFAFTNNSVSMSDYALEQELTVKDGSKDLKLKYDLTVQGIDEKISQLSIEVPVMASMMYKQLFANLGVRVGIPVISKYKQTLDGYSTSVTITDYNISIKNSKALGCISESEADKKDSFEGASFNLSLAFEGGYTFVIAQNWLSVGAYVDFGLVNNYDGGKGSLLDVDFTTLDPQNNIPATATVNSLTKSSADKLGNFDAGIRAVYSWPMLKSGKAKGKKRK